MAKSVVIDDNFEFLRKVDSILCGLGYTTGDAYGTIGAALDGNRHDGITVLFTNPNRKFCERLFNPKEMLIHCYLDWGKKHRSINMRVTGFGKNGDHFIEMQRLASILSDKLDLPIKVDLVSQNFVHDFDTQLSDSIF